NWAEWVKYPFRPGYSMVGRVLQVGKGVTTIKEGDRVASYNLHQQFYKAQLFNVPQRFDIPEGINPHVIPESVSSEDATWRSLAVTCQNAIRRAEFQFGEMVGVVGLGMLGQLVTRYLAAAGASKILVIDPVESRLALAVQGGATHTLRMNVK